MKTEYRILEGRDDYGSRVYFIESRKWRKGWKFLFWKQEPGWSEWQEYWVACAVADGSWRLEYSTQKEAERYVRSISETFQPIVVSNSSNF